MEEILKNLDSEKRDRIINSAIEEFSLYPYDKASTNNIVKNAGISKGLLFHYFGSKNDLYEKLIGFVIYKLNTEITNNIDWDETDIFERIKQLVLCKIKLGDIYPNLFEFLIKVLSSKSYSKLDDAIKLYEMYGIDVQGLLTKVYQYNIDYSLFKDPKMIAINMDIVRWTVEKYTEEKILKPVDKFSMKDYQRIGNEIDVYINVLKEAFYN